MTIVEAKNKLLAANPEMVVETSMENKKYFVFSLRHNTMPPGTSTGGACYIVGKTTGKIDICLITDPRAASN